MLATVGVGAVAIVVDLALSGGRSSYYQPALYVAVETTAALAGFAAAYLLFFRFRQNSRLDVLLIAVGLAILSLSNLFYGALPVAFDRASRTSSRRGASRPATFSERSFSWRPRSFRRARSSARDTRPGWSRSTRSSRSDCSRRRWRASRGVLPIDAGESGAHEAALVLQLVLVVLFSAASIAYLRRAEEDQDPFMTWLAIAAALRVFSGIVYSFSPSLEAGWLSPATSSGCSSTSRCSPAAAGEVTRYWKASREAAVLDERQRIARDLHDGLAQELAFIVRRAHRAVEKGLLAADALQIANAAERALDESRRVIATLTRPLDEPLDVVLSEAVKGVADRVGATVALSLDPGVHVAPDVREALVRIAREAVTNAARHGDASLVRVELENGDGSEAAHRRRRPRLRQPLDATAPERRLRLHEHVRAGARDRRHAPRRRRVAAPARRSRWSCRDASRSAC